MAFDFPALPSVNDTYAPAGGPTYRWNGVAWKIASPGSILTEDAGILGMFPVTSAPVGWLKANGSAVSLAVYGRLIAIYCGDANNATALHGYRCTNPASPSTSRSTTGGYIVVPDGRGEFFRGLDDGRGVDTARSVWAAQAQAIQNHPHTVADPGHNHNLAGGPNAPGSGTAAPAAQSGNPGYISGLEPALTGITIPSSGGGAETRPRNLAFLACIKY